MNLLAFWRWFDYANEVRTVSFIGLKILPDFGEQVKQRGKDKRGERAINIPVKYCSYFQEQINHSQLVPNLGVCNQNAI